MKLYSIVGDAGQTYYGGKTEALKAARSQSKAFDEEVVVYEHVLAAGKAGVVALANTGNWCVGERVIKTIKPRKSSAED